MSRALEVLAEQWRREAVTLRACLCEPQAQLTERHAAELLTAAAAADDELLTLSEAARVTGYSTRQLRNLTGGGALPNHGRPGSPLYRRSELPAKPGRGALLEQARASLVLTMNGGNR
jgi:hypothetical protein